jgi:hypothetical protein
LNLIKNTRQRVTQFHLLTTEELASLCLIDIVIKYCDLKIAHAIQVREVSAMSIFRQKVLGSVFAAMFAVSSVSTNAAAAAANANAVKDRPTGLEMSADLLLIRPLLLGATLLGSVIFVVGSPFAALGGNIKESGRELVGKPFKATFARCLGCTIENDTDVDLLEKKQKEYEQQ